MTGASAYDLFVLIDADLPEDRRTEVIENLRKQIAGGDAAIKSDVEWGVRKLAYEIRHRSDAYYHLFQIETGPELLSQLEHALAIDDAVLRHRFIRLPKGVPDTPPRPAPRPAAAAAPVEPQAPPTEPQAAPTEPQPAPTEPQPTPAERQPAPAEEQPSST